MDHLQAVKSNLTSVAVSLQKNVPSKDGIFMDIYGYFIRFYGSFVV